jgi:aspartate racemase
MIGGMSWVSTIEYYKRLNEGVNARLGGAQYARCLIHSISFGDAQGYVFRNDWDGFLELTSGIAQHLRNSGAEAIVLCANTAHMVADRLQARCGLPVIHIADVTADAIQQAGLRRVALLGTRPTMEMPFFRDRLAARGITPLVPDDADRAFIQATIFGELGRNEIREETRSRYLAIIDGLRAQGAEGVILGCTEIPLLIQRQHADLPLFDTTALHVDAAVEFVLS